MRDLNRQDYYPQNQRESEQLGLTPTQQEVINAAKDKSQLVWYFVGDTEAVQRLAELPIRDLPLQVSAPIVEALSDQFFYIVVEKPVSTEQIIRHAAWTLDQYKVIEDIAKLDPNKVNALSNLLACAAAEVAGKQ